MALTDEDVREILRLIDESDLDELRIETNGLKLHVVRGGESSDAAPAEPARASAEGAISAPMPGTFYRAEGPGMQPFVDVGSKVEPDTTVCIIEIMKMMNSVPAGVSGTITEICVDDAQQVAEGEQLFRIGA